MARSKMSYFCDSPFSFNTVISSLEVDVEEGGVAAAAVLVEVVGQNEVDKGVAAAGVADKFCT